MTQRLVYGFLGVFLTLTLGLSSCTPVLDSPEGAGPPQSEVQPIEEQPIEEQPIEEQPIAPIETPETGAEPAMADEVQAAVLGAIAADQALSPDQLTLQSARAESWPDGCLGLASADELCTQVITPGWEVTVTDGQTVWTYRTDALGEQVRLDSPA
ncbi:MAG: hypothetical protein AAF152_04465 [Cyanobacteria bacterium P01_A01_bin.114]